METTEGRSIDQIEDPQGTPEKRRVGGAEWRRKRRQEAEKFWGGMPLWTLTATFWWAIQAATATIEGTDFVEKAVPIDLGRSLSHAAFLAQVILWRRLQHPFPFPEPKANWPDLVAQAPERLRSHLARHLDQIANAVRTAPQLARYEILDASGTHSAAGWIQARIDDTRQLLQQHEPLEAAAIWTTEIARLLSDLVTGTPATRTGWLVGTGSQEIRLRPTEDHGSEQT